MNLVASLMVGPGEADRYLDLCVEHLHRFCDQVACRVEAEPERNLLRRYESRGVVVADGATPMFEHEGRARQELLDFTLGLRPTHVLAVDADEFVPDGPAVREQVRQGGVAAWALEMVEVWRALPDCLCVRTDGGWQPHPVSCLWRVPSGRNPQLRIANRQLACGRVPVDVGRGARYVGDVFHFGWTNPAERAARIRRYEIADGGRFHDREHLASIGWPDDRVAMLGEPWPSGLVAARPELLARTGTVTRAEGAAA